MWSDHISNEIRSLYLLPCRLKRWKCACAKQQYQAKEEIQHTNRWRPSPGNPFGHAPTTPTHPLTDQHTRANTHNPTLCRRHTKKISPFFFSLLFFCVCVCGQTPQWALKGPTLFFLGRLSTNPYNIEDKQKRGVEKGNDYRTTTHALLGVDWFIRGINEQGGRNSG